MEILIYTVLFLVISFFVLKNFKLKQREAEIEEYLNLAKARINQARYGNFQTKLDETKDNFGLYKSLNSLFESVSDRDLVINEYREKEKENYNLKEEFIAALTHDLKVPIIAQDKTFDLLLDGKFGLLSDAQKEVILQLKESNSDLKEMVISILETYKIENKGVELNLEKNINVESFLKNCVEGLIPFAQSLNKEINLHINSKNLYADFDGLLIKRVVNNLVSNALYNSFSSDKIDIHLNKTGDTFSIDVIDYGVGVDEEEIEKIFNKYYSITGKTRRLSSGLGLYLSNKIVKKHKGQIEVESKKNEGSIFRIILPVKNELL